MIRKRNRYVKPRKLYEKGRILEENKLLKKYGLKNKKEIWKTTAKVSYFRKRAMALAKTSGEEQGVFFNKLRNMGLNAGSISDVLDLKVEDLLERRLSTIIAKNKLANSVKQARQMIVHKKILVKGKVIDSPSYIVPLSEENAINVKNKRKMNKFEEVKQDGAESSNG